MYPVHTASVGPMSYDKIKTFDDIVLKNPLTIEQIATCLSRICRYSGKGTHFYSVAQHSVLVSYMVPQEYALEALHHDDLETHTGDIVGPFKRELKPYLKIKERTLDKLMLNSLGLSYPLNKMVHEMDKYICAAEMEALEYDLPIYIWIYEVAVIRGFQFWSMKYARERFIRRHYEIKEAE